MTVVTMSYRDAESSSTVGEIDVPIIRGNTEFFVFRFFAVDGVTPKDFAASTWVFRVTVPDPDYDDGRPLFRLTSGNGLSITSAGNSPATGHVVAVTFTEAQARSVPRGEVAEYELERRDGAARVTAVGGMLVGKRGSNDDV